MSKEIDKKKMTGLIGLAQRAGKLKSGEFSTEKSIKSGRSRLCIIASDASEATKKRFSDMAGFRKIPFNSELCDKDTLGHIIGREFRASLAVEDAGLAKNILSLIDGGNENGNR